MQLWQKRLSLQLWVHLRQGCLRGDIVHQVQLGVRQRGQAEVPGDTDDERPAHRFGGWGTQWGLLREKEKSLCRNSGHRSLHRDSFINRPMVFTQRNILILP